MLKIVVTPRSTDAPQKKRATKGCSSLLLLLLVLLLLLLVLLLSLCIRLAWPEPEQAACTATSAYMDTTLA